MRLRHRSITAPWYHLTFVSTGLPLTRDGHKNMYYKTAQDSELKPELRSDDTVNASVTKLALTVSSDQNQFVLFSVRSNNCRNTAMKSRNLKMVPFLRATSSCLHIYIYAKYT